MRCRLGQSGQSSRELQPRHFAISCSLGALAAPRSGLFASEASSSGADPRNLAAKPPAPSPIPLVEFLK